MSLFHSKVPLLSSEVSQITGRCPDYLCKCPDFRGIQMERETYNGESCIISLWLTVLQKGTGL